MRFNDNQLINDFDSKKITATYTKILEKEVEDLREIINKMNAQKNQLMSENNNGKYNDIIHKLSSDIDKLNSIVFNTSNPTHKYSSGYTLNIPDTFKKSTILADNSRLSPYRSLDEMGLQNEEIITPTPSRRGRPMQPFNFIDIAKNFAINKKENRIKSYPLDRNKYHVIISNNSCHSSKSLINNQIDIIRLILLYLTLRPNCKYTSILSTIATDQFDVFLELNK